MKRRILLVLLILSLLLPLTSCLEMTANMKFNADGSGQYEVTMAYDLTAIAEIYGNFQSDEGVEDALGVDEEQKKEMQAAGLDVKERFYKDASTGHDMYAMIVSFGFSSIGDLRNKLAEVDENTDGAVTMPISIESYDWGSVLMISSEATEKNSDIGLTEMNQFGMKVNAAIILSDWEVVKTNADKVESKDNLVRLSWNLLKTENMLLVASNVTDTEKANKKITRAQAVTEMYRALAKYYPTDNLDNVVLLDCGKETEEIQNAIKWAVKNKFSNGTAGTSAGLYFSPEQTLTREQAYCILYNDRILNSQDKKQYSKLNTTFTDLNEVSEWARPALSRALSVNSLISKIKTEFKPKSEITISEWLITLASYRVLATKIEP